MIYSMNHWLDYTRIFFQVSLSTTPTSVTINGVQHAFTLNNNTLSFNTELNNETFTISINSEPKIITVNPFEDKDHSKRLSSLIKINKDFEPVYTIPYCDLELLNFQFYDNEWRQIKVQSRNNNPTWDINPTSNLMKDTYLNTLTICRVFSLNQPLYTLVDSVTDTWTLITSLPGGYHVIITGIQQPSASPFFLEINTPKKLYEKDYWIDNTV